MNENVAEKTIEEVGKAASKGKIGKRMMIIGGTLIGLALGGLVLFKKSKSSELDDFDDEEDFEEAEAAEDSEEESAEE